MRGCTCTGLTLCAQCAALARRAGVLETPGPPAVSETAFMAAVIRVAKEHAWLCYHTHDSRRSLPGYPDLTLVRPPHGGRPGEAIWAECKVPGGRLTLQQAHWLEVLGQVERTEAVVWVPEAMPEIVKKLTA